MTRKALLESPPAMKRRVGEVAGGAAAECAAVCCCCPCSMMNLFILAFYKLPRGLCRKASAKIKKKRRCKKGLLPRPRPTGDGDFKKTTTTTTTVSGGVHDDDGDKKKNDDAEPDGAAFEKEMWDRFYGNGFWRSDSSNNKET